MKESKIIKAAKAAKNDGFVYMSSVVKSVFNTTYYHINKIDDVIAAGKWIPCPKGQCGNWHGRIGTNHFPEKCINKSNATYKYC